MPRECSIDIAKGGGTNNDKYPTTREARQIGLHVNRTPGGDCDHRHSYRSSSACGTEGAGGRSPATGCQQLGPAQTRRYRVPTAKPHIPQHSGGSSQPPQPPDPQPVRPPPYPSGPGPQVGAPPAPSSPPHPPRRPPQ